MPLIVDASVAIKWYVEEPGSGRAEALLARDDLMAPDLIFAEVGNAFWKRVRRYESNLDQAEAALSSLLDDIALAVPLGTLAISAVRLSRAHDHPVYDCLYAALALDQQAPLATADAKLAALSRKLGLEVAEIGP